MTLPSARMRSNRRSLLLMLLLVLSVYVVLPQLGAFRSSWQVLRHVTPLWVLLATGFTALTYLAAAATYRLLAFRALPYSQLVLVQLAAMFINRLLPAGIGALGINYAYFRRARYTLAQSATIITLNNFLGVVGHSLLVVFILLGFSDQARVLPTTPTTHLSINAWWVAAAVAVLVVVAVLAGRTRFRRPVLDIRQQLMSYRTRPGHVFAAVLTSMALTLCNVLCLGACSLALGVHISFAALMLVFTVGVGAGAATPTPGGLGGFEAGLFAGLVAYRVPVSAALALALLYRLVSYWLPLVAGALAFGICQRRRLFAAL